MLNWTVLRDRSEHRCVSSRLAERERLPAQRPQKPEARHVGPLEQQAVSHRDPARVRCGVEPHRCCEANVPTGCLSLTAGVT